MIREIDAGRPIALCVVVATRGSTPQAPGAMLCVDQAGQITGTVGGGCAEAEIRHRAIELLAAGGAPGTTSGNLVSLDLDHDFGFDDGLICGGSMDVAISVMSQPAHSQVLRQAADCIRTGASATLLIQTGTADALAEHRIQIEATPKLVIAGGGHVGLALANMAVYLGFQITVIDDRQEYANTDRFAPPIEPVTGDIAETLSGWPIDPNTYIVIVTRGHKHDEQALAAVLNSPAKYIGMIGSRRKITVIFDDLKHDGAKQEQLDRVHAPIGVAIKALTPEEIAVSIAAELISTRRTA